ncbi:polysaccharide biosynthesis/export family protein [Marinomonas shanghaiensis]|uniref:polysaccharide biosynthesis/export family protein n=1 Tax=Marinomonas shanghaiensis TaxID=2202418 RepID=UPI003A91721D
MISNTSSRCLCYTFTFVVFLGLLPTHASAESTAPSPSTLSNSQGLQATQNAPTMSQGLEMGTYAPQNRSNTLLPGEANIRDLLPSSESDLPPPYGANLFAGGYETERADGLNEDYLIAPGDKINIWMWGAVSYSDVATVDSQGNIFIPEIGPIMIGDMKASQVNSYVTSQIKRIYTNNVNVYVNLLTTTPVSIYLSGSVIRPGQYAGMASDSVLYFLKRAGGIDSERGSYREIQVIRNEQVTQSIDLYEFISTGTMPRVNFKDGDVIFVTPQKAAITVAGVVRNPFRFELKELHESGEQLSLFARPLAKASHVGVTGNRLDGPFSKYMTYAVFQNFRLQDGDKVLFNDDLHSDIIDVQITGSYQGPSYFTVKESTRLNDLLSHIPIDTKLANISSIYLLRKSVALRQKELLNESLDRLEKNVLTAPASSDGEATIRAKESEMILEFTKRARAVEPLGKVIISDNGNRANVMLEEGDVVVIPFNTDLIQISGEVMMPQAVVYNPKASVDDYVAWAGGFSDRANDKRIAIVRANGLVDFSEDAKVQQGDEILVLPKANPKNIQSIKDITQIIYQVAVAAKVALDL